MKLYINDPGDESVGIFSQEFEVECPFSDTEGIPNVDVDWFKQRITWYFQAFCQRRLTAEYDFERGERLKNELKEALKS